MTVKVITAPVAEPVSLAEAKRHLEIDFELYDTEGALIVDSTKDTQILFYIVSARRHVEETILNRALMPQTIELSLNEWPEYITLPRPPLRAVESVKYYDRSNVEYTVDSEDYFVDVDSEPCQIVLPYDKQWPSTSLRSINGIKIRYSAGYNAWSGAVDTDGTVVTWVSGDKFSEDWISGKTITIGSKVYIISSVTDEETLVLESSAGEQESVNYSINNVPEDIKHAMLILIAGWHDQREPIAPSGMIPKLLPFSVDALLNSYRIF